MKESYKAALLLSLLSPFFAEILSGSTTPLEAITNPLSFFLIWAFYGVGVLLVREAWVRWGRNYLRLMLLGFAYGIFEEGIIIKSWYNPNWPDLDVFAHYGRILGINVTWAVWLTIFHSIMSIAAPIIVVEIIYPNFKEERFIGKRGISLLLLIMAIPSFLLYFVLGNYQAPLPQYIISIFLFLLFIYLAKKIDFKEIHTWRLALKHSVVYGFLISFSLFFTFTAFPHSTVSPLIPIIIGIFLVLHFFSQMNSWHLASSLILGFLTFWLIPYDIVLEINGVLGESVLGIITFMILLYYWRKRFKD